MNVARRSFTRHWQLFKHFEEFFRNPVFWKLLQNTLVLSLYTIAVGFPLPIILALAVNEVPNRVFKRTVQTVTYAPYFISTVVMVSMIILLLSPRVGPVNHMLGQLGIGSIDFLGNPNVFRHIYVWSDLWQTAGYSAVIYLAALASIDLSLYDGAPVNAKAFGQLPLRQTLRPR